MLHSEKLARTKWCPFVRVDGSNRFNNSQTDGFENSNRVYHCIGSQCMGWRDFYLSHMKGRMLESDEKHGYCGFGDKPDLEQGW